jgi:hypothetical protein
MELHPATSSLRHVRAQAPLDLVGDEVITAVTRIYPDDGGNAFFLNDSNVPDYRLRIQHKKFWEEIIAYFPLIRHKPHRK